MSLFKNGRNNKRDVRSDGWGILISVAFMNSVRPSRFDEMGHGSLVSQGQPEAICVYLQITLLDEQRRVNEQRANVSSGSVRIVTIIHSKSWFKNLPLSDGCRTALRVT